MISFGSDPELMLVDKSNSLKSAIGIVPGSKEERHDLGGGHTAYYDNVLAECEIKPSKNADEAVENFRDCFQRYAQLIKPYSLVPRASAVFPQTECQHEDARIFGCQPEFDAYDLVVCKPPICDDTNTFRSAGGHVHIGFPEATVKEGCTEDEEMAIVWNKIWAARMCDIFIGIPSLYIDHDVTSKARRKLYGGAGSHRTPSYGVEYRSLSNFWVACPKKVQLIYELANFVAGIVIAKTYDTIWESIDPNKLRTTINSGDTEKAGDFMKLVQKHLPKSTWNKIKSMMEPTQVDFYRNWNIV